MSLNLVNYEEAEEKAYSLLESMSIEERFNLVSSSVFDASNPDTSIIGIERLKIPQINSLDATSGVRIYNKTACENYEKTTAFPCPLLFSATWNTKLSYEYAHAVEKSVKQQV